MGQLHPTVVIHALVYTLFNTPSSRSYAPYHYNYCSYRKSLQKISCYYKFSYYVSLGFVFRVCDFSLFFLIKPRDWLGTASVKLPVLCGVGRHKHQLSQL